MSRTDVPLTDSAKIVMMQEEPKSVFNVSLQAIESSPSLNTPAFVKKVSLMMLEHANLAAADVLSVQMPLSVKGAQ